MKIKILKLISIMTVICMMFCYTASIQFSAETSQQDETPEIQELYSSLYNEKLEFDRGMTEWFEIFGYDDGTEYEFGETPFELSIVDETVVCVTGVNGCMIGVEGLSAGNTVLNVKAPDGRTLDIEIEVYRQYIDDYIPKPCYAPAIEYDNSPVKVGETRAVRVYNPGTGKTGNLEITVSQSENCKVDYEEGSDTFYLTAIHEGSIDIWVSESTCAFSGYIELEAVGEQQSDDEESETTEPAATTIEYETHPTIDIGGDKKLGDLNKDGKVNVADLVKIQQMLNKKAAYTSAADMNRDGTVNVFDVILLKRIIISEQI